MYNGKVGECLTSLRHSRWNQSVLTSPSVNPATLPPTERATHYHSLRVHLELVKTYTLSHQCNLNPLDWGWQRSGSRLVPIMTDLPPAPKSLLDVIRCSCNTATNNTCGTMRCSCRKNGLKCMDACGDCRGVYCDNASRQENLGIESDMFGDDDGNAFQRLFGI